MNSNDQLEVFTELFRGPQIDYKESLMHLIYMLQLEMKCQNYSKWVIIELHQLRIFKFLFLLLYMYLVWAKHTTSNQYEPHIIYNLNCQKFYTLERCKKKKIAQKLNLPLGTVTHKKCSSQILSTVCSSIDSRMQNVFPKCGSLDILGYLMPQVCLNS